MWSPPKVARPSEGSKHIVGEILDPTLTPGRRPISVFMMDLLAIVPYYAGHLCKSLVQEGIHVIVGSITYDLDPEFYRELGLTTSPGILDVVARTRVTNRSLRRVLKFSEALINLLASTVRLLFFKPDVVHVQFLSLLPLGIPFELWFVRLAKLRKAKVVYTVHNLLPQDGGKSYRRTFMRVYHLADALICHDEETKSRLIRDFKICPENIFVIPHGLLFTEIAAIETGDARRLLGIPDEQCIVLWQGVVRSYKGIPFLLDAWQRILRAGLNTRLIIVGTGQTKKIRQIEEQVVALGIQQSVQLELRFVPRQLLGAYYRAADIIVYPYKEITTSGALLTGINAGKAIVATNLPFFTNILDSGKSAALVDYGDVEGLAAALMRLIKDPVERANLAAGSAGLRQRGPCWVDIARQTRSAYATLLGVHIAEGSSTDWAGDPDCTQMPMT